MVFLYKTVGKHKLKQRFKTLWNAAEWCNNHIEKEKINEYKLKW